MRTTLSVAIISFAATLLMAGMGRAPAENPRVVIDTEVGQIEVELDATRAPHTVANFLRYIDEQYFDGTSFYRTVTPGNQPDNAIKIEVIQGGADGTKAAHEPIALEPTSVTGLRHGDGTLSMARNGPDTATSEFFICIGDQPELDFGGRRNPDGQGFAAFGHVVKGLDIVKLIQQRTAHLQRLVPPVAIRAIRRSSSAVPFAVRSQVAH
jgi:peptidyl-prolyl cis-trans isomerase A (cyclophilin A)